MSRWRIVVVGTGYVGLTTGACLARLGNRVVCCDVDADKVDRLSRGRVRIHEPGLEELVRDGLRSSRLRFATDTTSAASGADMVFVCVPTPMRADGSAETAAVASVVTQLGRAVPPGCVLVVKSTVPVGTAARAADWLERTDVAVVSNPEFLREGSAVHDFLHPDRIVVGSDDAEAADRVARLYAGLGAPTVKLESAGAEMVKYAANCFLATRLSYVNTVAQLCERMGADIADVTRGMGQDHRVGPSFLRAGPGWGGSCLPKDTRALLHAARSAGHEFPLLRAVVQANTRQRERMIDKVAAACGRDGSLTGIRLGVLGLAFKAGTDDLRNSPALEIARGLDARGAELMAVDPGLRGDEAEVTGVATLVEDAYQAAKGAAGLVLLTDWPEFSALDWPRLAGLLQGRVVVDARNHLDPPTLARAGIAWYGLGHPVGERSRAG